MNLLNLPKLPLSEELTTILVKNKNVIIEQIISTGQVSDWYDQEKSEFVILLEGNAEIEYENAAVVPLIKGDTLLITPHQKHRVVYTSCEPPCIWLCVYF
ncbi:cupin domain-containing protein [Acetobacterium bakii]|uniref:Cupin n=1 Tax=Acetobacterium bakii TaxID=52689 RepID=A0A0L6U0A1_9FIRM|nr:cupin domain-containing protein [Acetobacterium bakii]KNZ41772.1 cupin [Acetobacterium bakii]